MTQSRGAETGPAPAAVVALEDGARAGESFGRWRAQAEPAVLLLAGAAEQVLTRLPDAAVDCVMTSPPYWGKREYAAAGLGLEASPADYVRGLLRIGAQLQRVLSPSGSFWLNIGDSYQAKNLLGLPWRVAHGLMDEQGWVLRNDVIWNKLKGSPDNARDKLRNVHEHVFHFVKDARGYYYDDSAVRSPPRGARVVNGAVVSATGVRGVRYERQIELSSALTDSEKNAARLALREALSELQSGRLGDFRMVIRKQQRATHSDSSRVSGRARELEQRGFYFLKYHPGGAKLGDVWDVLPEDTQGRAAHFAPYPEDLCKVPILATCPAGGIVLDPFCGTGTTLVVAEALGRRGLGIDVARSYLEQAEQRLTERRLGEGRLAARRSPPP